MKASSKCLIALAFAAALGANAGAEEAGSRKELKRGDLTGTGMEVVISVTELKPGDSLPRHIHHGEEALYVIDGGTIELPNGQQVPIATGNTTINVRDVAHGGFKVVGDKTVKFVTVHVADKGQPLYDAPK